MIQDHTKTGFFMHLFVCFYMFLLYDLRVTKSPWIKWQTAMFENPFNESCNMHAVIRHVMMAAIPVIVESQTGSCVYSGKAAQCLSEQPECLLCYSGVVNINVVLFSPRARDWTDIDECVNETICGNHGFCENTDGSFRCQCDQGYTNPPADLRKCVGVYLRYNKES